jgi:hypothetical protein
VKPPPRPAILEGAGFARVAGLDGGMKAWNGSAAGAMRALYGRCRLV